MSYLLAIYRKWEIAHHGKINVNGVLRGANESGLSIVMVLVDSILFGYVINFLSNLPGEDWHKDPFFIYWVIIDCTIMFLQIGFVYLGQFLVIQSDITKNIYTLYFLQSGSSYTEQ